MTGEWKNVWRVGTVSLGGVTGSNQFANGKPQNKEGAGIEPMYVASNPPVASDVSVLYERLVVAAGLFMRSLATQ